MIFGTCLVETCVVDAHPKLHVSLRDDHRIGQPPRVVDLPYEASVEQFFDFFTNEVLSLNRLLPGASARPVWRQGRSSDGDQSPS
jgi:hypothetical protein